MAKRPAVRSTEVQRTLVGVRKAGREAEKIEVLPGGGFFVHLKDDAAKAETAEAAFDKWKAKQDARSYEGP
jgi:hypothetical protein